MNDRNAQEALMESPSFLLQELGLQTVHLYRPRIGEWQWLPIEDLDDEIWQRGEALVFRHLDDGQSAIIRLGLLTDLSLRCHHCPGYALVSVRPDYVGEGRKFLVSLREEALGGHMYLAAMVLRQLKRMPLREEDIVLPPFLCRDPWSFENLG